MSEIYDYINDLVNGFRPMHRNTPSQGQSEWYYMNPSGSDDDTSIADMSTVDIAAPDIPNPVFQTPPQRFAQNTSPIPPQNGTTIVPQGQTPYNPNLRSYMWEDSVPSSHSQTQPQSSSQVSAPQISEDDNAFF